jgi:hypothetical protein
MADLLEEGGLSDDDSGFESNSADALTDLELVRKLILVLPNLTAPV